MLAVEYACDDRAVDAGRSVTGPALLWEIRATNHRTKRIFTCKMSYPMTLLKTYVQLDVGGRGTLRQCRGQDSVMIQRKAVHDELLCVIIVSIHAVGVLCEKRTFEKVVRNRYFLWRWVMWL